jgi:hypothetical protein
MPRRMACALTIDAVHEQLKTVTRRRVETWTKLAAGDPLTLIEKGMGLPKGATQVVLAEVEVVDVRVEPLAAILDEPLGVALEGLRMRHSEFIAFWLASHKYPADADPEQVLVRRIAWRYLT